MTGAVREAVLHSKERPRPAKISEEKGSALRETPVSFLLRYRQFYKRNRITRFITLISTQVFLLS